MRISGHLQNVSLLLASAIAVFAIMASGQPKSYQSTDPRIQQVRKGVEYANASHESQRISREFIGTWSYHQEIGKAIVPFSWQTLLIGSDGIVVMEYQGSDSNRLATLVRGRYEFIHKGTKQQLPGKRPTIIITPENGDTNSVVPLVNLTVDFDSRVPASSGMVLKFYDLEDNEFVFLRSQ